MTLRAAKSLIPKRAIKLQIIRTTFLSGLIVLMLVLGLWSEQVLTLNVSKLGHLFQVTVSQKVQQPEVQPLKPVNVLQETGPPKQTREAASNRIRSHRKNSTTGHASRGAGCRNGTI